MQMSHDYLARARASVEDAQQCLQVRQDYALCVVRSAESVEFGLKAALLWIGETHQFRHEVSDDLFTAEMKFPDWFRASIPRFALASAVFTMLTRFAKYGNERQGVPPSRLFAATEATLYLTLAREVLDECERLTAQ